MPTKTRERSPSTGHLYVRTSDGPGEIRFLFEQQEKRIGWATGASMVTHALLIAVIFALISYTPELTQHPMLLDRTPPQLVWIAEPGAGGGGGGGGNRQQEPPKKAEESGESAEDKVRRLKKAGKLNEDTVADAVDEGQRAFARAALIVMSELKPAVVDKILSARSAKGMTALAWKAGLSMRTAVQLQTRLGGVNPRQALQPRGEIGRAHV